MLHEEYMDQRYPSQCRPGSELQNDSVPAGHFVLTKHPRNRLLLYAIPIEAFYRISLIRYKKCSSTNAKNSSPTPVDPEF